MDKALCLALTVFCLLGFSGTGVSAQCTAYRVDACLKPFQDRFDSPIDSTPGMADKADCRYYKEEYSPCVMATFKDSCFAEIRTHLEVLDVFDLICSDRGMALLERHRSCLYSREIQHEERTCNATLQRQLQQTLTDVRDGRISSEEDIRRGCGYIEQVLSCVRKPVTARCGTEAADFNDEIMLRVFKPVMKNYCKFAGRNYSNYSGGSSAIIALDVVSVMAAVLLAAFCSGKMTKCELCRAN